MSLLGAPSRSHVADPIYGRPAQPTGRDNSSSRNLNVKEDPRNLPGNLLRKSINPINNTYLDENSYRGDGANVISDRLNFGGRRNVVGPPQIQYVQKPVERIVYEDEVLPAIAPINVIDDSINQNARNILAEVMAKACLLVMEGNRLKWVDAQRTAELTRLRGGVPMQMNLMPTTTPIVRPPVVSPTVIRPTTFAAPTTVIRPSYTTTTTVPQVVRPAVPVVASPVPTVIRPTTGAYTSTVGAAPLGIRTSAGVVTRVNQVGSNVGAPVRVSQQTLAPITTGYTSGQVVTSGYAGSPVITSGAVGVPRTMGAYPATAGPIRSSGVQIGSGPGGVTLGTASGAPIVR